MKNQGSISLSEIVFSITMQSVLSALNNRLGKESLSLSIREYIDIGRDSFEILREP